MDVTGTVFFSTMSVDTKDEYSKLLLEIENTDLRKAKATQSVQIKIQEDGTPIIIVLPELAMKELIKKSLNYSEFDVQRIVFLLFIDAINNNNLNIDFTKTKYSIAYGHPSKMTTFSNRKHYSKAYQLLPSYYKKNLSNLYVLHPNYGLKLTMEYFRFKISSKLFKKKLRYVDSIIDLQEQDSVGLLDLPTQFHDADDQQLKIEYGKVTLSLNKTFDTDFRAPELLYRCGEYIENYGLKVEGIFRKPGSSTQLMLALKRAQHYDSVGQIYFQKPVYDSNNNGSSSSAPSSPIRGNSSNKSTGIEKSLKFTTSNKAKSTNAPGPNKGDSLKRPSGLTRADSHIKSDKGTGGHSQDTKKGKAKRRASEFSHLSAIMLRDPLVVSSLFKRLLHDLPEPVITYDAFEMLMKLPFNDNSIDLLPAIESILERMPGENQVTLEYIMELLVKVVDEAENRMDANNICKIFAPTLMRDEGRDKPTQRRSIFNSDINENDEMNAKLAKSLLILSNSTKVLEILLEKYMIYMYRYSDVSDSFGNDEDVLRDVDIADRPFERKNIVIEEGNEEEEEEEDDKA